jgi:hypothetical protein
MRRLRADLHANLDLDLDLGMSQSSFANSVDKAGKVGKGFCVWPNTDFIVCM